MCTASSRPDLDVEMILGMASGVTLTYWTEDVFGLAGNPVLQFLPDLSSDPSPSLIHSMSWGPKESDLDLQTAMQMNEEFVKLSMRGLAFLASSGGDGVNNRAARTDPSACSLVPQSPSSFPYVTDVGGTFGPEYG